MSHDFDHVLYKILTRVKKWLHDSTEIPMWVQELEF